MALYSLIDVSSEETSKPTSVSKPMSNFRRQTTTVSIVYDEQIVQKYYPVYVAYLVGSFTTRDEGTENPFRISKNGSSMTLYVLYTYRYST